MFSVTVTARKIHCRHDLKPKASICCPWKIWVELYSLFGLYYLSFTSLCAFIFHSFSRCLFFPPPPSPQASQLFVYLNYKEIFNWSLITYKSSEFTWYKCTAQKSPHDSDYHNFPSWSTLLQAYGMKSSVKTRVNHKGNTSLTQFMVINDTISQWKQ